MHVYTYLHTYVCTYVRMYACSHVYMCYDTVQSRTQVLKFSEEIQINLILYQYARRKHKNTIFFIVTTLVTSNIGYEFT